MKYWLLWNSNRGEWSNIWTDCDDVNLFGQGWLWLEMYANWHRIMLSWGSSEMDLCNNVIMMVGDVLANWRQAISNHHDGSAGTTDWWVSARKTHWSYVFLALTHRDGITFSQPWHKHSSGAVAAIAAAHLYPLVSMAGSWAQGPHSIWFRYRWLTSIGNPILELRRS